MSTTLEPRAISERAVCDLAEIVAGLVDRIVPDCEGACLGTSAILAHVLDAHGVQTRVVRGEYDEHPHWWLETNTLRIDATRRQFGRGLPLVEMLAADRDEDPYTPDESFPSLWTREQAIEEFARMFEFGDVGEQHGRRILADLEHATRR